MTSLVQNELFKLFKRKSSWILQIILLAFIIITAVLNLAISKMPADNTTTVTDNQQSVSVQHNSTDKTQDKNLSTNQKLNALKAQKKIATKSEDKKEIQKEIDYYQAYVDKGKDPSTNLYTNAKFFSMLGGCTTVALIAAVIMASMIVASEFTGGTIKLLLTRPYSRSQILLSKFIAVIFYGIVTCLVMLIGSFLVSFILPHDSFTLPLAVETGSLSAIDIALRLAGADFIVMLFFISISMLFSSVARSQALAVGAGIGTLLLSNIFSLLLPLAIEKYNWIKWIIFNLLNLNNNIIQGSTAAGGLANWQMIAGLSVYIAVIVFFTFYIFKKRDVALS